MATDLHCSHCHKHVALIRDAKIRPGMVAYCKECAQKIRVREPVADMPEFMRGFFKAKKHT